MSNSKMNQAEVVFQQVSAEGFDLQGKTVRAAFVEKAMAEVGLSKAGASTYYQNLRNKHVNGKNLYEYNKTAKKDVVVEEVKKYVPEHRWTLLVDGEVVNSFPSRAKAQAAAKEVGGKWGDLNKAA